MPTKTKTRAVSWAGRSSNAGSGCLLFGKVYSLIDNIAEFFVHEAKQLQPSQAAFGAAQRQRRVSLVPGPEVFATPSMAKWHSSTSAKGRVKMPRLRYNSRASAVKKLVEKYAQLERA